MNGHTPPMIRNAMDDVMSSLDDMTLVGHDSQHEREREFNPWSPEAFDNFRRPNGIQNTRPMTSLDFDTGGSKYSEGRISYSSRHNSPDRFQDGSSQLETYVQRMESRLRRMQQAREGSDPQAVGSDPPEPPPKNSPWASKPAATASRRLSMRKRKSAFELGADRLNRTYTTKTNSTNSSSGAQSVATNSSHQTSMTSQSLMSGFSASGLSATSAGSLARKRMGSIRGRIARPMTSAGIRNEQWEQSDVRPKTPTTTVSFHSSHVDSRSGARSAVGWDDARSESVAGLGGFTTPKSQEARLLQKVDGQCKNRGGQCSQHDISKSDIKQCRVSYEDDWHRWRHSIQRTFQEVPTNPMLSEVMPPERWALLAVQPVAISSPGETSIVPTLRAHLNGRREQIGVTC